MNGAGFLILIVAFAFLWLVLVRPQKKRQVAQRQMLTDLRIGDEVLTAGGIYGTIVRLDEEHATLEIARGIEVKLARRAIAGVTPRAAEEEPETAAEPTDDEPPTGENPG